MKRFVIAVILSSLCFSVGEGLRLTPFPVANLVQIEVSVTKDGFARSTYGPLDIPSQVQKRSKRQTTDFGPQPIAVSSPVLVVIRHRVDDKNVQLRTSLFVSRPSDRAPPFLS